MTATGSAKKGGDPDGESRGHSPGEGVGRRRTLVRRSYHSQELVTIMLGVIAVALAGQLMVAMLLVIPGFGYWFWILLKDRRRLLIGPTGGVAPDGEDIKYPSNKSQVPTGRAFSVCVA